MYHYKREHVNNKKPVIPKADKPFPAQRGWGPSPLCYKILSFLIKKITKCKF